MTKLGIFLVIGLAAAPVLLAADPVAPGPVPAVATVPVPLTGKLEGKLLAAGDNRIMILNRDGSIAWERRTGLPHDTWMLENGNILYADGGSVTEITQDQKIVFQFKSKDQRGGGSYACQRLANGNTVIGENSTGKVLELDPQGKVVFELQTQDAKPGDHHNQRMVRKLDNGNYLVCHSGGHVVREYKPDGTVAWEQKTPNLAFAAIRKANGNTLISTLGSLIEYKPDGTIAWEFKNTDIPGLTITNMTGMQLLPNGNIVTSCYQAYKGNQGCGLLEITPDKKAVWSFASRKTAGTMMAVQKLTAEGKPMPEKPQR
jgi:outer membrane protein assembly factor BamB